MPKRRSAAAPACAQTRQLVARRPLCRRHAGREQGKQRQGGKPRKKSGGSVAAPPAPPGVR